MTRFQNSMRLTKLVVPIFAALLTLGARAEAPLDSQTPRVWKSEERGDIYRSLSSDIWHVASKSGNFLLITGDIKDYDDLIVQRALEADPTIRSVVLEDNIGGLIYEAKEIGYSIRERQLVTYAYGDCFSAFVDIFVAGTKRWTDGVTTFGVHAPDVVDDEGISADVEWYEDMGVPQLLKATYSVPNRSIYTFSGFDAVDYGIADDWF